ncbi:MAG: DNA primase, partial [Ruminococcaceae bacterium]|nr:DNA primase [Oscillospiraceae bacterium]
MPENKTDLIELLDFIDPAALNYTEWVGIGMALKHEGYSAEQWDAWSSRDHARYHQGECAAKWLSFSGTTDCPVTGGTIVALAKQGGWSPRREDHELDWNDSIGSKNLVVIDKHWIEGREITAPRLWNPVKDLITYLETLFESTDKVGYVTRATKGDGGRISPSK